MDGDCHLRAVEHARWLRRDGHGVHRAARVGRLGAVGQAAGHHAQRRAGRHGAGLVPAGAVGRPLGPAADDHAVPGDPHRGHGVVGAGQQRVATGRAARVHRRGHRRHAGRRGRDHRRVRQPQMAQHGGGAAGHRLPHRRHPGRRAGGLDAAAFQLAQRIPDRRRRVVAVHPAGAQVPARIAGFPGGPASAGCLAAAQRAAGAHAYARAAGAAAGTGARRWAQGLRRAVRR